MANNPEDGSFEVFGETSTPGMSNGGLDLGGELSLPTSLTDPLAQHRPAGLLPADPAGR